MGKYLDTPSTVVALLTFALFIAALFVKGITHDLFLEAGVFLISIKILMMMHLNRQASRQVEKKLDAVLTEPGPRESIDKANIAEHR
jgi:hypothetical protein